MYLVETDYHLEIKRNNSYFRTSLPVGTHPIDLYTIYNATYELFRTQKGFLTTPEVASGEFYINIAERHVLWL